jgi:hypothetical protein
VNLVLSLPLHSHCLLACALSHPLVIWYPTVYHDETYFVVLDLLRQPLASKSDKRPVGTLQGVRNLNSITKDTTYLRTGVRNCCLRENKYATYTKGAWSVRTVSVGHGYGSVGVMTVSKRYT